MSHEASRTAPVEAQVFRYERPVLKYSKAVETLCQSELLLGAMQVLRKGGENNLHAHSYQDGFWFVLSGRVRFYTTGDQMIAELGRHEGVLIPRHYPYWFESVGDEEAEVLQVEASTKRLLTEDDIMDGRVDFEPQRGLLAELAQEGDADGAR